jgi:hypothetical protein
VAERQALEETLAQIAGELKHLRQEEIPKLQPRKEAQKRDRRVRQWIGAMGILGLCVLGVVVVLNANSTARNNQIRSFALGNCQRGNDFRATFRQVITIAVADIPVPDGITPEARAQYDQRNAQTEALRNRLLALPTVQPVDCAAALKRSPK